MWTVSRSAYFKVFLWNIYLCHCSWKTVLLEMPGSVLVVLNFRLLKPPALGASWSHSLFYRSVTPCMEEDTGGQRGGTSGLRPCSEWTIGQKLEHALREAGLFSFLLKWCPTSKAGHLPVENVSYFQQALTHTVSPQQSCMLCSAVGLPGMQWCLLLF